MTIQDMLDTAAAGGPVTVEAGWTQGRAVFGGLTGALLLAAMRGRIDASSGATASEGSAGTGTAGDRPPLRSLTVSFVAPSGPGPLEVEAEVLRAGSNVTQARASLVQDGKVVATALGSFGRHRSSAITVAPARAMPSLPAPATVESAPYLEGLTPEFFRFVDLRLVDGSYPFAGSDSSAMTGWMSLREAPERYTEELVVLLADAWPPAVLQMLEAMAPASSLTWTLEFVAELHDDAGAPLPGDRPWAYEVATDSARDGYAHTHALLWRPDGTLTAISRQTVTVFG